MTDFVLIGTLAGAGIAVVAALLLAMVLARTGLVLPQDRRGSGCLDGLRGFLALSVVVHHFWMWVAVTRFGADWEPPGINFVNQLGAGAVGLFFMITGFLFYAYVLQGFSATSWHRVYVGRFFRIVPLVGFSVLVILMIICVRNGTLPDASVLPALVKWISTWAMPPLLGEADAGRINAYVLWSLKFEWQFYIFLLPACAVAMDVLRRRKGLSSDNALRHSWIIPAGLLGLVILLNLLQIRSKFLIYVPLFAAGMLANEASRIERLASALRTSRASVAAGGALISAMLVSPTPYGWSMPLFGFFFLCVVCGNSMGGLLRLRAACALGECSFGLYLMHGIVLSLFFTDAGKGLDPLILPFFLPLLVVISIAVSVVGHVLIEKPGIRLGRRLLSMTQVNGPSVERSGLAAKQAARVSI
ncbi:acyltransferase family protein [Allorhizobium undicola]|uniref:acyltransferase family protein n=1 Tax=Allorhizobium undicola TaxID=78527 RepID=UPI0004857EEF|nr:acyltransferase [Allorhizobium undicola]